MKTSIFINDIRFHTFHGVMTQERAVGADFTVSVRLGYDFTQAMKTDDVADTISYADVYELLKAEMAVPSNLLEHAAGRMVECLKVRFPEIHTTPLSLTKLNPPMGADCAGAGVEIHWTSLNNDKTLV